MKNLAKSIIVFLALATAIPSHAEWEPEGTPFDGKSGNDFGVWMTVGAEKKINKKWSLGLEFEYRLRDNIVDGKGWGAQEETTAFWGSKHRVYVSVTGSYKVQNVKFSLRERWQYTYRPEVADVTYDWEHDRFEPKKGKGKNVSRTRLQISYDKKRTWWEPYISAEMYIAHGLEKMRYTAGCDFKINKQNHIDLYYRFVDIRENDNFNNRD